MPFIILLLLFTGCNVLSNIDQQNKYVYSIQNPIEGQKYTATRLKWLMDNKKYDEAILLFSAKQQADINKIREDSDKFPYWCYAWTMDDNKLARYLARIDNGRGNFVFEAGEWKIDEK